MSPVGFELAINLKQFQTHRLNEFNVDLKKTKPTPTVITLIHEIFRFFSSHNESTENLAWAHLRFLLIKYTLFSYK